MISLAGRDILHAWGKFVFTGIGLGLLIGVTLTMAGVYRGMVDDANVLLDNSGADLWVVQRDTQGPYAESSSLYDDTYRSILGMSGVARVANVTYLTMQVSQLGEGKARDVRAMVVGIPPDGAGHPGQPGYLVEGRRLTRGHYEAVADIASGFALGDRIRIRRNEYTVVGLTRRMVSSGGDPMVFIPLKDAQEAQFLKDNDAIRAQRARTAQSPALNRPGVPGLLNAVIASQSTNTSVNAVLVQIETGADPDTVAEPIRRWKHLSVYTRAQMQDCHSGEANCHVPSDSGDCQRGHRCLHHLHPDHGQDQRDRGAQAHWHDQPHHCRDDSSTGRGTGFDRICGWQSRRYILGPSLSEICAFRTR